MIKNGRKFNGNTGCIMYKQRLQVCMIENINILSLNVEGKFMALINIEFLPILRDIENYICINIMYGNDLN